MVVVRESPHAKLSPSKNTTQWPPKSPFQALLSSPSGRKKWQDSRQRSVSPSPGKRVLGAAAEIDAKDFASMDSGDEEDEETLQLQLKAIQAKLKLKKLQQKRERGENNGATSSTSTSPARLRISREEVEVEVPVSPTKNRIAQPLEPVSPARRRLGLTRDPRAENVSLKRARDVKSSLRRAQEESMSSSNSTPKESFSERLGRSRAEAQMKVTRQERIASVRSTGFGMGGATTEDVKRPSSAHQPPSPTKSMPDDSHVQRSQSTRSAKPPAREIPRASNLFKAPTIDNTTPPASDPPNDDSSAYDPLTRTHLTKRHISHPSLTRHLADRAIYTVSRLLAEVKAPDYDPPDVESDYVLLAILASKSNPFDHAPTHHTSTSHKPQEDAYASRNKFMVLHLCDGEKWELDCFLFGAAFDAFWKLTPGTLLAILNPAIMPPKGNQHTGKFSLKLASSEDGVLEIGIARHLGWCEATKKDGSLCGDWVNKRKTTICEFHLNLEIERARRARMEVNTMGRMHRGGGSDDDTGRRRPKIRKGDDKTPKSRTNVQHHHEYGRIYSLPPTAAGGSFGSSTAHLLDQEDTPNAMYGIDASRQRMAAAQKERDLAKQLAEMGSGVGREYFRAKTNTTASSTDVSALDGRPYFEKPALADLGLLGNKATEQRLSPAKDRRRHFGLGAVSSSGRDAIGWGGARKAGFGMGNSKKDEQPEAGQTSLDLAKTPRAGIVRDRSTDGRVSPKKRARFALEKGIREPGRESLGGVAQVVDDDDDDLDII